MKKYTITLMLTLMGMVGCKNSNTNVGDFDAQRFGTQRIDTALVLGKLHGSYSCTDHIHFLLVNKKGDVVKTSKFIRSNYDFSNVGDTVIVATDKDGVVNITKNLTMENKIRAFTKQR